MLKLNSIERAIDFTRFLKFVYLDVSIKFRDFRRHCIDFFMNDTRMKCLKSVLKSTHKIQSDRNRVEFDQIDD